MKPNNVLLTLNLWRRRFRTCLVVMELFTRTLVTEPKAGVNTDVWKKKREKNVNIKVFAEFRVYLYSLYSFHRLITLDILARKHVVTWNLFNINIYTCCIWWGKKKTNGSTQCNLAISSRLMKSDDNRPLWDEGNQCLSAPGDLSAGGCVNVSACTSVLFFVPCGCRSDR